MRIEFHPEAREDFLAIGAADQRRIRKALIELAALDEPRQRLVPYSGNLKGFWKLRVGDYRLVCELGERNGRFVLIIYLAHRSRAYSKRGQRAIRSRADD
ncbi:MAG: type II toxin-antitoxin system RelE/ParE family toxin [Phyllobacteriaceae bacterium]|nr:type II toxin-antitoxin system RelE/ParE family toxin [Phyllobacteriaceae bacterium]